VYPVKNRRSVRASGKEVRRRMLSGRGVSCHVDQIDKARGLRYLLKKWMGAGRFRIFPTTIPYFSQEIRDGKPVIPMKKALVSALCSAFVIPGLGQILNQDLKKGAAILTGCFLFFCATVIKLYRIVHAALRAGASGAEAPGTLMARIRAGDFSALWILLGLFGLLWAYSVTDAFLSGKKRETDGEGEGT